MAWADQKAFVSKDGDSETAIAELTRRLEHFEKEEIRRRQRWEARLSNLRALRIPLIIVSSALAVGIGASIAYRWVRR